MAQGGELTGRRVSLVDPDLVPVRHVGEGGEHIAAQATKLLALEQRRVHDDHRQGHEQRRQQPAGPAKVEVPEVDASAALVLADQQQRDEVAADHEEHLDSDEPAGQPRGVGVVHHHGDHGEGAHPVEAAEVRNAGEVPAPAASRPPAASDAFRRRHYDTPRPRLA